MRGVYRRIVFEREVLQMSAYEDPADRIAFDEARRYAHMKARARYTCDNCDEPILDGDRFLDYDGIRLCDECVRECMRYA